MFVVINDLISGMKSINKYSTVLIIDSGVGGLSIYQELRFLLPNIFYIYFFDNEVFPYGEHSNIFILDRVINIFKAVCRLHMVDLAIIACNTATVVCLEEIRSHFFFPVIGIVPDIQLGIRNTSNGVIGLLATHRTINSKFILNIVNRFSTNYKILLLSVVELVQLAEDKILNNKKVSISLLYELLSPWLSILKKPDTIILGCTHFLHLRYELQEVFSCGVYLVGSAKVLAYRIAWFIIKNGMYNNYDIYNNKGIGGIKKYKAYCSFISDTLLLQWLLMLYHYGFSSLQRISV